MKKNKKVLTRELAKLAQNHGNLLMGGDVEAFAIGPDGVVIPADAAGFFPYSREYVRPVGESQYHKVFADGVQVELNFTPATCRDGIVLSMNRSVNECIQYASRKRAAKMHALSAVKMTQAQIDVGQYLSHVMGCNPDFSAYTDTPNRPIEDYANHPIRTAGYHVQFGKCVNPEYEKKFAKLCDRIVGLVAMWGDRDESHRLRKGDGVGLAGCYRNHPADANPRFEYRTCGSFWLRKAALSHALFGMARMVHHIWESGMADVVIDQIEDDEARAAINNCDNDACKALFMRLLPFLSDVAVNIKDWQLPISSCNNTAYASYTPIRDKERTFQLAALVWMLDGNMKFDSELNDFTAGDYYGWNNYSHAQLRYNAAYRKFETEFMANL